MKMRDILNKLLKLGINHVFYDEGVMKVSIGMENIRLRNYYTGVGSIGGLLDYLNYSTEVVENFGRRIIGTDVIIKFTEDISSPSYKKRKIIDVLMEECTFCFLLCMKRIRTTRPVGVPLIPVPLWKIIALMNY